MSDILAYIPVRAVFKLSKDVNALMREHLWHAQRLSPRVEVGGSVLAYKRSPSAGSSIYETFALSFHKGKDDKSLAYDAGIINASRDSDEFFQVVHPSPANVFYLGEWHTHFYTAGISDKDKKIFSTYPRIVLFIVHNSGIYVAQQSENNKIIQVYTPFGIPQNFVKVQ